ncbi:MAG: hypothetical protein C4527_09405 [Candidatus Omnitrophota bacterium]|jgi:hypothetical protein|nr:MAG: hypothetical protein C4527_09405 [Candidatus Omnitrophota bacterium]
MTNLLDNDTNKNPSPPKRLGEALIDAGLLLPAQLQQALSIQQEQPHRALGEIIISHFDLSNEEIESVFVNQILIPAMSNMLIHHLKSEESKFTSALPIRAAQLIYQIDVCEFTLTRITNTTFSQNEKGELTIVSKKRNSSTTVNGELKILIQTRDGETVCVRDKLTFAYESEGGKVKLDGSSINGIRFSFSRKNKERMGEDLLFQPITEEELRELLERCKTGDLT